MWLMWLASAAMAGNLYVNGTFIDPRSIAGMSLEEVTVRIDADGNLHIDAPGYKIEVVDPPAPPPTTFGGPPQPAPYGAPPQPYAAPPQPYPQPAAPQPLAAGINRATWWLVTEDNQSTGHTIEVMINDRLVHTIRSGQPQKILDVGQWLSAGSNRVVVKSNSAGATGGTFYVYMGKGSDQSGTVVMDAPQVQFGVGSSRNGPYSREYTLTVN